MEKVTATIQAKLTDEEMIQCGKRLGRLISARIGIEEEKKSANASFKERLEMNQKEINRLKDNIASGTEERDVVCFKYRDFDAKTRVYIDDKGNVLKTEPFNIHDYQYPLPINGYLSEMSAVPLHGITTQAQ